jgi:hypothetical protein
MGVGAVRAQRAKRPRADRAPAEAADKAEPAAAGSARDDDEAIASALPRRVPGGSGSHSARKVRPGRADPGTLREILDGLNRL